MSRQAEQLAESKPGQGGWNSEKSLDFHDSPIIE
jgi:hypothetical protein